MKKSRTITTTPLSQKCYYKYHHFLQYSRRLLVTVPVSGSVNVRSTVWEIAKKYSTPLSSSAAFVTTSMKFSNMSRDQSSGMFWKHTHTHTVICIHMHTHIQRHAHVHTHTHTHTHMIYAHTYTHIQWHTHMCTHTYTHTQWHKHSDMYTSVSYTHLTLPTITKV